MDGSTQKRPTLKSAASVIVVREGKKGPEVYLLRRHRKAGFMASSYVFPGGICDPGESDWRHTAARELLEEAGVLLSDEPSNAEQRTEWRNVLNAKAKKGWSEDVVEPLPEGVSFSVDSLHYFAHWITPTLEKRRYEAKFYLAQMPEGQEASPDNHEMVDEIWVTPQEALQRAKELRLPPPQIRTFMELLEPAQKGMQELFAEAKRRSEYAHAILPRELKDAEELTIVLPWDPDYADADGDSLPMPAKHALAWGPSRFVLRDGEWLHTEAPVR